MSSSKSDENPESSVYVNKITFNMAIASYLEGNETTANAQKWDPEAVSEAIRLIEEYKAAPHRGRKRNAIHYNRFSRFDVVDVAGVKELIRKRKSTNEKPVIVPAHTRYFEILSETHKNTDHGGSDRMCQELENSYSIPRWAVSLFVGMCVFCQDERGVRESEAIVKPIVNFRFNSRGQMDLIDLQSVPDGEYRWILYYQEHFTRYSFLRALKHKNAVEVAVELFHIFTMFGYPQILQSDQGDEFTASVIAALSKMWPECRIEHGRPKHPGLLGSVRSAIGDVKNCLRTWMHDSNTRRWSTGLLITQWRRNTMLHSTIRTSPYFALFGKEPNRNIFDRTLNSDDSADRDSDEPETVNSINSASPAHLVDTEDSINADAQLVACPDKAQDSAQSSQVIRLKDGRICSTCGRPFIPEVYPIVYNGGICQLCSPHTSTVDERINAAKRLKRSAEAIPEHPAWKLKNMNVGDPVLIPLPKVNRGPLDSL